MMKETYFPSALRRGNINALAPTELARLLKQGDDRGLLVRPIAELYQPTIKDET